MPDCVRTDYIYWDGLLIMQKDALKIVLVTAVSAVFGAFLRWLQLLNAFDAESGLFARGAKTTPVLAVYMLLAAALFAAVAYLLRREYAASSDPAEAFAAPEKLKNTAGLVCAVLAAVVGVVLMLSASNMPHPGFERVFAAGCIFAAAALPLFLSGNGGVRGVGGSVITVFFALWLVYSYRCSAEDPALWKFLPEVLAILSAMLAWFHLTAYSYGRAKPFSALFWVQAAAFLNIVTLSDERGALRQVLFLLTAAIMLAAEYLLCRNLRQKQE